MTDYPFEQQLVVDPDNPENIVRDGEVWLYDPADTAGTTPLALTDPSGLPIVQPMLSNAYGFLSPFVATVPQVLWKSGPFENYFNSFTGMWDQAVAAAASAATSADEAQAAQAAAAASEQYAQGPTDEQADAAVRRAAQPSNLALAPDGVPYILPGANEVFVYDGGDGYYYFR